jgi:hypothetical protein
MNIELLEQLKAVAEYDGYKVEKIGDTYRFQKIGACTMQGALWFNISDAQYDKQYNALMPVAKKVYLELSRQIPTDIATPEFYAVYDPLSQLKTWLDISELFTATFTAITFLNSLK